MKYSFVFAALIICLFPECNNTRKPDTDPLNVLFITVDDLRPQLGCYGDRMVHSPNIDKLAAEGCLFENAYTQYALCGPSRTSVLTGFYPRNTGVTDLETHFREIKPETVTLPQLFKNNGYHTCGMFKVFHLAGFAPDLFPNMDDPESWSEPSWLPTQQAWGPAGDSIYKASLAGCLKKGPVGYGNIPRGPALEAPDIDDGLLNDGEMAITAVRKLRELQNKPFFLALGFYHPHLPFVAPKKYWDLYQQSDMVLPYNQYLPKNAPPYVTLSSKELRSYPDIPDEDEFSEELKKRLLHGYLASISFVDAQIGLVMDELEKLGLDKNTVVVLLGDHGYQIGEHNHWCKKHCNFEMATRVPLIISVPGKFDQGEKVASFAELVDLYPTLADICRLQPPAGLDGKSVVAALENSDSAVFGTAVSSYKMGGRLGTSIRTSRYRFTEWKNDTSVEYELYDHRKDPDENINHAGDPEYQKARENLILLLKNEKQKRYGSNND